MRRRGGKEGKGFLALNVPRYIRNEAGGRFVVAGEERGLLLIDSLRPTTDQHSTTRRDPFALAIPSHPARHISRCFP